MKEKIKKIGRGNLRLFSVILLVITFLLPIFLTGCGENTGVEWFSGTESPNISFGKIGDFYLDEDDHIIYKFTDNGWVMIGQLQTGESQDGQDGQDGEDGTSFLSGNGAPANTLGKNEDLYLNISTYDLYKKTNGSWSLIGNIKGADGSDGQDGSDGSDGQQGEPGTPGQDGATILSGALDPTTEQGKDGDLYFNTMSSDLFQKVDGVWTKIANIRGEAGEDGITPHIGENGNWWVGDEDTGYSAVGENGESSTVSVDEDGYLIIDGDNTGYNLNLTSQELYENLQGIIEYDDGGVTGFSVDYESVAGYEYLNQWEYTTSVFSGWAGLIGNPETINAIKFRVRARETAITQIGVALAENDRNGTLVAQGILEVNVQPYEEADIIWQLDETIVNDGNLNYFFGYSCDAYVDKFGLCSANTIPEDLVSGETMTRYAMNGRILTDFTSDWSPTETGQGYAYAYIPVQVGHITGTFKLADIVIQEILDMVNVEEELYQNTDFVLPSTIYGYVGQKMQIYFRNIIAYDLDDVYVRVDSTNGNQYSDRWEYTPETAETFNLTIELYSKNWTLLSSETFEVVVKDTTSQASATALVIGDSTVQAGTETQQMLTLSGSDEQFDLTLIGTRGDGENKHEGRGGWTASGYVTNASSGDQTNPFYNAETQTFDFSYYMTQNGYDTEGVDVVFIQLGINDIFGRVNNLDEGIQTFIDNMKIMIESIHEYDSTIKIVINLIIPCDQNQDSYTEPYGNQAAWLFMRNMYKANQALLSTFADQENVYLSWYNAALDAVNNQGGNVHPSTDGYNQLGTQMYYFFKAIL